jgi:hypothetical protein
MQTPSLGRIVLYHSSTSPGVTEPRAAIITRVHNQTCVDLTVFDSSVLVFPTSCVQGLDAGQWSWPERV